jgi:S1-C subfamily serine protease
MTLRTLIVWAGTLGAAPASALTPAEVYAQVSASVWRVVTYDADGLPLGLGSGVVIGEGIVVTNCHVLARAKRVAVKRDKLSIDAKLKQWDAQRDVCALEVRGLAAPMVSLGDTAKVQVGQPAYAIGNPQGLDLTMSSGLVSSLRKNEAGQLVLIQTSAAISVGSSGGGLFDEQGALIGLTTIGSAADAQNLNFAVPVEWIKELPARHDRLQGARKAAAAASAAASAPSAPR